MFYRIMSVMLLLLVAACSAQTSATSCDACHHRARCVHDNSVHDNSVETVAVSCRCDDGWVGDGFTCYDPSSCNQGCCSQGYRWSALQGCVDIDECSLPQTPCGPRERCQNTKGSFSCRLDLPQRTAAQNTSVTFSCGGRQCPSGQDCLLVDGTSRCMDPCDHYTPLDDAWRATDVREPPLHCDQSGYGGPVWQGWYRLFLGNSSVQMPETCIQKNMCGTHIPLWLQTPHPQLSAGIIQAQVCGHWVDSCCYFPQKPIHVKACPGNYYVYKFIKTVHCHAAYCADVNTTTPVCNTCTAAQTCVRNGTVWRCEDKYLELVCGSEQMRLTVPKMILEEQGLNGSSAHLVDPRCHQQLDGNGTISYLVDRRKVCGTLVKNNGTHVTYSNIVFVFPSGRSNSSISVPRSFPFSCVFPLDDITSLDAAIRFQPPASGVGVVSSGDPTRASMTLYTRPDFSEAFPAGPVRLPLGSALHVAVSVNNTEYDGFGLLLETCYVTHSPNASDPRKHLLIQNRCAVDRRHVQVLESGASLRARFSALLFLYHGTYEDVYLHCSISMCDRSSAPCSPNCSRRQARSAASSNQLAVAVGPISWF